MVGGQVPLLVTALATADPFIKSGKLKVDELVTRRYTLDEVNEGYQDMLEGRNIRGVIRYTDADR